MIVGAAHNYTIRHFYFPYLAFGMGIYTQNFSWLSITTNYSVANFQCSHRAPTIRRENWLVKWLCISDPPDHLVRPARPAHNFVGGDLRLPPAPPSGQSAEASLRVEDVFLAAGVRDQKAAAEFVAGAL